MGNKQRYIMAEAKIKVQDYFIEQIQHTTDSLKSYEVNSLNNDNEVNKIRAIEEVKLRDRLDQLQKHLYVMQMIL